MNIGYEISISPAKAALFEVMEKPIHNSAINNTPSAPKKYRSASFEETRFCTSFFKLPEK